MTGSITSFVPAHEGAYVYSASKYGVRRNHSLLTGSFSVYSGQCGQPFQSLIHEFISSVRILQAGLYLIQLLMSSYRIEEPGGVEKGTLPRSTCKRSHRYCKGHGNIGCGRECEWYNPLRITLNCVGKAVICIGDHYIDTEDTRERLLPQLVTSEVTEGWGRVLAGKNPFVHMSG